MCRSSCHHPRVASPGTSLSSVEFSATVGWHGVSLRAGRFFLRTWRPYAWLFPRGYREPTTAYLVEFFDERDSTTGQLGGFTNVEEAEACLAQMEAAGWRNLHINMVPVHDRLQDWQFDL